MYNMYNGTIVPLEPPHQRDERVSSPRQRRVSDEEHRPTVEMVSSEGARIDELRGRTLACGLCLSTDALRDALLSHAGDVRKAAAALAALAPKARAPAASGQPATPPGLRTPARPALIVPDADPLPPPATPPGLRTPARPALIVPEADPLPPPVPAAKVVVRVGVAAVVRHPVDRTLLVGVRRGSHGASKLAFPGGHLEMNESWEECARRECLEETGMDIDSFRHVATTNDPMPHEVRAPRQLREGGRGGVWGRGGEGKARRVLRARLV